MESHQFITNGVNPNHFQIISRLLKNSEETIICVAFLKSSGLDRLLSRLKAKCTFYIGTDYYLTEPIAIKKLIRSKHQVFLVKKKQCVFHPKTYYFRQGANVSVIAGSANLTGGGIETNFESSFLLNVEENSAIDLKLQRAFNRYKAHSEEIVSELQLADYEVNYLLYHQNHKKADREFKKQIKITPQLPLVKLKRYFKTFLKKHSSLRKQRIIQYNEIKIKLDEMISASINSPKEFLSHYEPISRLFFSSDLLRGKTIFAKGYKKIIKAAQYIQNHTDGDAGQVFSKARKFILGVKNYGVNGLTEIMNAYGPTSFSVANGRTRQSLTSLGSYRIPTMTKKTFDGNSYKQYNNLLKWIQTECKAKSLGEIDLFLSCYYNEVFLRKN